MKSSNSSLLDSCKTKIFKYVKISNNEQHPNLQNTTLPYIIVFTVFILIRFKQTWHNTSINLCLFLHTKLQFVNARRKTEPIKATRLQTFKYTKPTLYREPVQFTWKQSTVGIIQTPQTYPISPQWMGKREKQWCLPPPQKKKKQSILSSFENIIHVAGKGFVLKDKYIKYLCIFCIHYCISVCFCHGCHMTYANPIWYFKPFCGKAQPLFNPSIDLIKLLLQGQCNIDTNTVSIGQVTKSLFI